MENTKQQRLLEIFFRSLRGEDLSVRKLAAEYSVSAKSISRDISGLKNFLADHRELVGNTSSNTPTATNATAFTWKNSSRAESSSPS